MRLKGFKIALEFLTIFKLGSVEREMKPDEIASSIAFFPAVGLLLGGICSVVEYSFQGVIASENVRALFSVGALALFTRGLHLDGVADCFDALPYAYNKEKALKIMKSSSIGAFGASALIVVLLGKILAISSIPQGDKIRYLLLVPSLSRWTSAIGAGISTPAVHQGLGYIFTTFSSWKAVLISGMLAFLFSIILLGWKGVLLFIAVSLFGVLTLVFFKRRFGGVTGDVLGTVLELSELLGFIAGGVLVK